MNDAEAQFSLFAAAESELLIETDGDVRLFRNFFSASQAAANFEQLYKELDWQQSFIHIAGRKIPVPRLNAWYGDPGCHYQYSGIGFDPLPWTPTLRGIRDQLTQAFGQEFNSVLANLYRDGRDSVAWHSDDELELGRNPVIASVSLGAVRRFTLKHKFRRDIAKVAVDLPTGSLIVMAASTQHYWAHQLSKTAKPVGPRINLTFRNIVQ